MHAAVEYVNKLTADLKRLKEKAHTRKKTIKGRAGDRADCARRVFCGHLLMIFEDATGKLAKTNNPGPAHNFFAVCFSQLIKPVSDESIYNYLKETIGDRNKIKKSPLFY